jgi:hypothetical protein
MPRPDAVELLAKNLQALPHPDGTHLRFLHFSTFAQTDDTIVQQVNGLAQGVGEALVNLLETNGYTLTHTDDPKPVDATGTKTASIHCNTCGERLMLVTLDDNLRGATDGPQLIQAISKMGQECPHG